MARLSLFEAVPDDALARLARRATRHELVRKEQLWLDGDNSSCFEVLVGGCVKLVKMHEGGRETILLLAGPGTLLCPCVPYQKQIFCCSASVISERATVIRFPRDDMVSSARQHASIALCLLDSSTCRAMSLCRRMEEISIGRVEQRLAKLFLRLVDDVGVEDAGSSIWLPVVLSRQDLADLCATTIETAIRTMRKLERGGLIQTRKAGFLIRDAEALTALCMKPGHSSPPTRRH